MDQMLPPKSDPPQALYIPPQSNPPRLELLMQEIGDDEPTIKMRVPPHLLHQSGKYQGPNWGLLLGLAFCLAFWGSIAYAIWR